MHRRESMGFEEILEEIARRESRALVSRASPLINHLYLRAERTMPYILGNFISARRAVSINFPGIDGKLPRPSHDFVCFARKYTYACSMTTRRAVVTFYYRFIIRLFVHAIFRMTIAMIVYYVTCHFCEKLQIIDKCGGGYHLY